MSKIKLLVAVCAATLGCWIGASEAHAQNCAWQTQSPVVTLEGSYESNFQNCGGQSGGTSAAARVWITSGRWNGSVRRSLICNTTNNVGILVVARHQNSFTGSAVTKYRRGAAPNCSTTYSTAGSVIESVTHAACNIGIGSACLAVSNNP